MVTDQQYRDLVKRIDDLEKKLNAVSRSLVDMQMKSSNKPAFSSDIMGDSQTHKRDITKYIYNDKMYSKRDLVRAIITQIVTDKHIDSYQTITELFPDYIQGSLGVIRRVEEAEKYKDARSRFYFDDADIIRLGDDDCVVCKEWQNKNIQRFLDIVETLGYQITPVYRNR